MSTNQYIDQLPPERRPVAQVWAHMPAEEFQARVGIGMDDICAELARIRRPAWKTSAQWVAVAVASAVSTALGTGQIQR